MYLEEFEIGKVYSTGRICVHEGMIYDFAQQYDSQPFHLDPHHPIAEAMGGLFASGYQSLAVTLRLTIDSGLLAHNIIGLGLDEVRWVAPLFAGQVVSVDNEILSATPSKSKPDRGVLKIKQTLKNTKDSSVLMYATLSVMIAREEAST